MVQVEGSPPTERKREHKRETVLVRAGPRRSIRGRERVGPNANDPFFVFPCPIAVSGNAVLTVSRNMLRF